MKVKKLKFWTILSIEVIILFLLLYIFVDIYLNRTSFKNDILDIASKNDEPVFSINNIVFFSSCNADASVSSNSNFLIENLYQYTDIAIFLNNGTNEELDLKNTLKEVYIDNINFINTPELGTPNLYYKNLNSFASTSYNEENKLTDNLHFNISSEDQTNLDSPTLYNNCANPITLSYVNNNIKTDYTIDDIVNTYDGSILKRCSVPLTSIKCDFSFDIHIINNLDQEFICPVYINVPLETENASIYDGKLVLKDDVNYTFYRLK